MSESKLTSVEQFCLALKYLIEHPPPPSQIEAGHRPGQICGMIIFELLPGHVPLGALDIDRFANHLIQLTGNQLKVILQHTQNMQELLLQIPYSNLHTDCSRDQCSSAAQLVTSRLGNQRTGIGVLIQVRQGLYWIGECKSPTEALILLSCGGNRPVSLAKLLDTIRRSSTSLWLKQNAGVR